MTSTTSTTNGADDSDKSNNYGADDNGEQKERNELSKETTIWLLARNSDTELKTMGRIKDAAYLAKVSQLYL